MTQHFRRSLGAIAGLAAAVLLSSCAKKVSELRATLDTSMGPIVVKLYEDTAPKTVANFVGLADGTRLLKEGEPAANAKPFYDGLIFHRVIPNFMIQGGDPLGSGIGGPGYTFEDETHSPGAEIAGPIPDLETAEYVFMQLMLPYLREHRGNTPSELVNGLFKQLNESQSFQPLVGQDIGPIKQAVGHEGPFVGQGKLLHEVVYGALAMANSGPNTNGSQFFIVTAKDGASWLNGKHTVFGEVIEGMEVAEAIQNVARDANDKPLTDVVIKSIRFETVKVPVKKAE